MSEPTPPIVPRTVFGRLGLFVLRHPTGARALIGLLTVVALLLATRLRVESDLLSLLPSDEPEIAALKALEAEEGGVNLVTVTVRGEPANTREFLTELQVKLEADERVDYALYDIDDELAWRLGVLSLSTTELEAVRDRLIGALSLGPAITNPFISARLLDLGPMTERLKQADARGSLMSVNGLERLVIRPAGRARDLPFARGLMALVNDSIAALEPSSRGVEVVYISGAYRFNVEDYEGILADTQRTGMLSLALILGLMLVAFRDPKALLLVFTPLVLGTIWTFGFAGAAVGVLNTFTSVLGALLLGLGIDFAIHLYTRYREERLHSRSVEEAVARAWDSVGPPCTAAALTSIGGFGALLFAQFKGFRQMGLLLMMGVGFCLLSALVVLPLLLQRREQAPRPMPLRRLRMREGAAPPTYRLAPVGLLLLAIVTVTFTALVPRLDFEYDLSELRREGAAFADLSEEQQELTRHAYAAIVASYPDAAALDAAHAELQGRIDAGELQHIGRLMSIRSVIPADQDARLAVVQELNALAQHPNYGYLPAPVRENLARLQAMPTQPVQASELPRGLQHLLGASDGHHRLMLFASGNVWDLREVGALRDEVFTHVKVPVAGEYLALGALYRMVRQDMPLIAGVALALVVLFTALDMRRLGQAAGAVAVLLAGMAWAGGMVAGVGVKLSIVNIVAIPILLGIGVDVVIHLLHRLAEEGPGRVLHALSTTGFAAGLSATTTILSFAALSIASNQGVRSLGLLVLVGLSAVTVAAFLILPVGWMTVWKIAGEAPADTAPPPE